MFGHWATSVLEPGHCHPGKGSGLSLMDKAGPGLCFWDANSQQELGGFETIFIVLVVSPSPTADIEMGPSLMSASDL